MTDEKKLLVFNLLFLAWADRRAGRLALDGAADVRALLLMKDGEVREVNGEGIWMQRDGETVRMPRDYGIPVPSSRDILDGNVPDSVEVGLFLCRGPMVIYREV